MTLVSRVRADVERVEQRLTELSQLTRADLSDAVGHQVGGTRRRLRPQLALQTYYLVADEPGPATDQAIEAATVIEMIHVGSVYHDDVIDQADSRHGRPSVHARWGQGMAILAGDYIMIRGVGLALSLGERAGQLLVDIGCRMIEGMVAEQMDRFDPSRTEEACLRIIEDKTASLLSATCALGALQGGGDDECVAAMTRFGHHIGVAYQLFDDVLDLTATAEQMGKPTGNDIREGVYTVPLLRMLNRDPGMRELLRQDISDEDVTRVLDRVRTCGAVDDTLTLIGHHVDQAVASMRSTDAARRRPETADEIEAFVRELLSSRALAQRSAPIAVIPPVTARG